MDQLSFWEHFAIQTGLGILRAALKDPKKQQVLQTTLLALRDEINATYPGQ